MFQVRGRACTGAVSVLILYELTLVGEETVTWALVCFVCCMILLIRSSCSRVRPSPSSVAPSLSVMVGELASCKAGLLEEHDDDDDNDDDADDDDDAVEEAFEDVDVVGESSVTPVLMGRFMALICSSDRAMPVAASTTLLPVEM